MQFIVLRSNRFDTTTRDLFNSILQLSVKIFAISWSASPPLCFNYYNETGGCHNALTYCNQIDERDAKCNRIVQNSQKLCNTAERNMSLCDLYRN